mmetsp:Transcript_8767/g.26947  ORF Transcript_8767/g.26947 Transcript_8767/m.26947 type:complete len:201 (-) Transcript_8767:3619-4221(-)
MSSAPLARASTPRAHDTRSSHEPVDRAGPHPLPCPPLALGARNLLDQRHQSPTSRSLRHQDPDPLHRRHRHHGAWQVGPHPQGPRQVMAHSCAQLASCHHRSCHQGRTRHRFGPCRSQGRPHPLRNPQRRRWTHRHFRWRHLRHRRRCPLHVPTPRSGIPDPPTSRPQHSAHGRHRRFLQHRVADSAAARWKFAASPRWS